MDCFFKKVKLHIHREESNLFVRRVAWLDVHDRVYDLFHSISLNKDIECLGGFFIKCNQDYPPYKNNRVDRLNSLNLIQINLLVRELGINYSNDNGELEGIIEKGAALVFSQDITGAISVFIFPNGSQVHSAEEKNIMIGHYYQPMAITDKEIENIFKIFVNYCVSTMHFSAKKRGMYFFRLYLQFKDLRNRKKIQNFSMKILTQTLIITLAALGVLATLYTGGVIKI